MGMSEPEGPGRKDACLLIPAMPLLAPQLLTSSLPALSNLGTQSADSWWLRVAWEFADPYVRAICEKMKGLEEYPGYGFAVQIDVTVGNALLIESAARDKKRGRPVRLSRTRFSASLTCQAGPETLSTLESSSGVFCGARTKPARFDLSTMARSSIWPRAPPF